MYAIFDAFIKNTGVLKNTRLLHVLKTIVIESSKITRSLLIQE
jgi:hypothetical protein